VIILLSTSFAQLSGRISGYGLLIFRGFRRDHKAVSDMPCAFYNASINSGRGIGLSRVLRFYLERGITNVLASQSFPRGCVVLFRIKGSLERISYNGI